MSEGQVSIDDVTHRLPSPFVVLATQNPVEHFGTYPLPESQMDRFLLRIQLGYPSARWSASSCASAAARIRWRRSRR